MNGPQFNDLPFNDFPGDESQVIGRNSRSFSVAARLLPQSVRADVHKLYAWCRVCDDAVDHADNVFEAGHRITVLSEDVEKIYRGETPAHPASHWLADLVERYDIDPQHPKALLDGMESDLRLRQVHTEDELIHYCYHAAGVVGLMMCRILGAQDRRGELHAKSLGIAMQLTNIARDVLEDWQRGRCYLPSTWVDGRLSAVSPPDSAHFESAVRRILRLADQYYAISERGVGYLPPPCRPAIRIASAVYREIGAEIARSGCRVMEGRTVVPKPRFILAATASLISPAVRKVGVAISHSLTTDHPTMSTFSEQAMNDAKYFAYLGLSLTCLMGSALFLLLLVNPKDASYSWLPAIYAAACLAIGWWMGRCAKKAEQAVPVPVEVRSDKNKP